MRLKNVIHASTYIRGYPMLTLYIADAERDAGMKKLSREEAAKVLEGMKVKTEIPKATVTQWERNAALDMAIEVLTCSEIPNKSDTISRQAAIDKIVETSDEIYKIKQKGATYPHDDFFQGMAYAENVVKQLPPAQPDLSEYSDKLWQKAYERGKAEAQAEIVQCKDCRFNTYSKKCLNPDSFFLVPADDFYCGYAERRTDEQTKD